MTSSTSVCLASWALTTRMAFLNYTVADTLEILMRLPLPFAAESSDDPQAFLGYRQREIKEWFTLSHRLCKWPRTIPDGRELILPYYDLGNFAAGQIMKNERLKGKRRKPSPMKLDVY